MKKQVIIITPRDEWETERELQRVAEFLKKHMETDFLLTLEECEEL